MPQRLITDAENRYRSILAEECRRLFNNISMPSHDHLHHERVWKSASLLLERLYEDGMVTDPRLPEKAIIASFFHDTGLTVNHGPDHGHESRQLCSLFLDSTNFSPGDRQEILDAVEKHDNKEYQALSDPSSLAAIISVADDMDAFGQTGIERYTEIYTMRSIPVDEMPRLIIDNVMSRIRHLETTYHMFPDIVAEQRTNARIVIDYFTDEIK
jgi:HD superfamily phosphodiesterase